MVCMKVLCVTNGVCRTYDPGSSVDTKMRFRLELSVELWRWMVYSPFRVPYGLCCLLEVPQHVLVIALKFPHAREAPSPVTFRI